jgi:prepilin-type N-terminal cleavage/methylation domain-containing protein
MNKRKEGFTLAEVMIAMGVIGVIALVCIPTFIQFEQDRDIVISLKRDQSIIAQATKMAEAQNGDFENWELENLTEKDIFNQYYKNNLKVNKVCQNSGDCWEETSDFRGNNLVSGGSKYGITGNSKFAIILPNGTNMTLTKVKEIDEKFGINTKFANTIMFLVDVNGAKGPNAIGKDVFAFALGNQGQIIPAGEDNDSYNCRKNCDLDDDFWDCSAKVLKDETRDYI